MADYRLADHPPARVDPSEESTFMSRVRVWPLVLITAFAVSLAACGSSSPGASTTPSTKATTATTAGAQPPARTGASTIAPIPTQDLSPAGKAGTAPTLIVPPGAPPTQLESANLLTGTGAVATVGQGSAGHARRGPPRTHHPAQPGLRLAVAGDRDRPQ